jgi:hypothetical protein
MPPVVYIILGRGIEWVFRLVAAGLQPASIMRDEMINLGIDF